jgi:hypothetical protein
MNIQYSAQYATTNKEGHEHPPPAFGAPTLVWHLAVSPHWDEERPDFRNPLKDIHGSLASNYETTRTAFIKEINVLLTRLQAAAGYPRGGPQTFDAKSIPAAWQGEREGIGQPFFVTNPGSVHFTLWWSDAGTQPEPEPTRDALRIKVHAGAYRDYVTLSFYLDALKPWNEPPQTQGGTITGTRRGRILSEVERVRAICEARMAADASGARMIDREVLPEEGISPAEAGDLLAASRYLYAQVWSDFCQAAGLSSLAAGTIGRVFANFRGLVMATDGVPDCAEPQAFPGSSGIEPFPRFKGNGGIEHDGARSSSEPNEANGVVKAFWPFVRRSIPHADRREFVACGVMSWRALYVTALNCPPAFKWKEEVRSVETEIAAASLPDEDAAESENGEKPVRYLLITKGQPHRRQIGRIVERINAMGTMRLIALRDYGIIRDASTQIQLRGQELDTMMRKWSTGRADTRKKFAEEKKGKSEDERRLIQDREEAATQVLADKVENDLVELSAALDRVGDKSVHGLHFRINRSRYYVAEFDSLLASLKVGNIDTWVSYDQFVTRGLKPAFDFIDGVGTRLLGLRTRLQSVLEGIETSALVGQTSAMRMNTEELRKIAIAVGKAHLWLSKAMVWLRFLSAAVALAAFLIGSGGVLWVAQWLLEKVGH